MDALDTLKENLAAASDQYKVLAGTIARLQQENKLLRIDALKWRHSTSTDDILRDNHEKQARIDTLERQLSTLQARCQRWRRRYQPSSPIGSEEAGHDHDALGEHHQMFSPTSKISTSTPNAPPSRAKTLQDVLGSHQSTKKRKHESSHRSAVIPSLAEDREYSKEIRERTLSKTDEKANSRSLSLHRRLNQLLEAPGGSKTKLSGESQKQRTMAGASASVSRMPAFLPPKPQARPNLGEEKLSRSKRAQRQSFSRFKINPQPSSGLDHIREESVQRQNQRKCLPSCTKAECCGRKMAVLESVAPRESRTKIAHVTSNQALKISISNNELLQNFLGPNFEDTIPNLTEKARENLLSEARVKLLADVIGKHRHTSPRARSPPGFWTADMPGTQEEPENKWQASTGERAEVDLRDQEACNEYRKWMFADKQT